MKNTVNTSMKFIHHDTFIKDAAMIRINYYCNFLNEMRSLFVGSEQVMEREVERLNKLDYTIHSIELPSNDT